MFRKGLLLSCLCLLLVGLAVHAEVPLPDELRSIPVYPGGVVEQAMDTGQGTLAVVKLPAGTAHAEVLAFFRRHFQQEGWTLVLDLNQGEDGALSYTREGLQAMITVSGSGDDNGYTIVLAKQE